MSINSANKLVEYIYRVAKEPVCFDGEQLLENGLEQVTISDSFFGTDGCTGCGRCCMNENTVWTNEGLNRIYQEKAPSSFTDGLHCISHNVNGLPYPFWEYPADTAKDCQRWSYEGRPENLPRCHWLICDKPPLMLCKIHKYRPITCGMPHMRFFHTKGSTRSSIGLSQYGRNHQLGCPVHFIPFDGSVEQEQNIVDRIEWLRRLSDAANDIGIETWLPEILQKLNKGVRHKFTVGNERPRLI